MTRGRIPNVEPKTEGARQLLEKIESNPALDQTRVAAKIEAPPGLINHLLHGRRAPSLQIACKIEKSFGIPPRVWLEEIKEDEDEDEEIEDAA